MHAPVEPGFATFYVVNCCTADLMPALSPVLPLSLLKPTFNASYFSTDNTNNSSCKDTATNCDQLKNLCTNNLYKELMAEKCTKTCNYCGGTSACKDEATNCADLSSLCTNNLYQSLMSQLCKQTCGLCNAPPG
ncbi:unnamed protein product [Toxocara canis]|uniref:ShTK domain protein n=1 Tax=Toxocara canis TaxID=6265 RepID=A0A183UHF7_TOXCA|nr:unnamed protein product [Toxocara canis]